MHTGSPPASRAGGITYAYATGIGGDESKGEPMGHLLVATSAGGAFALIILYIALYVVFALGVYGTYKKAGPNGDPAWSAFVPIYNFIIMLKVAGRPLWWGWFLLLPIIPFLGSIALLVISIIVLNDVSKSFGHGGGFTVGLVLLSVIFWYILWLGKSQYRGPAGPAGVNMAGGGYMGPGAGYPPAGQSYPPAGQSYHPGSPIPGTGTSSADARLSTGRPGPATAHASASPAGADAPAPVAPRPPKFIAHGASFFQSADQCTAW